MYTQSFKCGRGLYELHNQHEEGGSITVTRREGAPLMTMTQDYAFLDYNGKQIGQAQVTHCEIKLLSFDFDIDMEAMPLDGDFQEDLDMFVQAVFEHVALELGL